MCLGMVSIAAFWSSMAGNPQLDEPNIRARPNFNTHCIPQAMHGDGTPISGLGKMWACMADIWHWSSCLGEGTTMQCCMYIFSIAKSLQVRGVDALTTYTHFCRKLRWSFFWLWLGRHPTRDCDGQAYLEGTEDYRLVHVVVWLADGLFAIPWALVGDMEHFGDFFGFPRTTAAMPCWWCLADSIDISMPWTDFRTNPGPNG